MSKNAKQQLKAIQAAKRAEKPVRPLKPGKPALDVEGHLRAIVLECLGGPGGDPDEQHLLAAAHAVVALKLLGFTVPEDDEYFLSTENHLERDFLEEARTGG